jgi:hypothetical protein
MTVKDDLKAGQEVELDELMREGAFAEADAVLIASITYAKAYTAYRMLHTKFCSEHPELATDPNLIRNDIWMSKVMPACQIANDAQRALNDACMKFYGAGGENLVTTIPTKA